MFILKVHIIKINFVLFQAYIMSLGDLWRLHNNYGIVVIKYIKYAPLYYSTAVHRIQIVFSYKVDFIKNRVKLRVQKSFHNKEKRNTKVLSFPETQTS